MLATLTVAALICVASVLAGEALARLLRLDRWRGWSPAVGLAAIVAIALAAVKLPGHGSTGAIVLAAVVALAAIVVGWPGGARPRLRPEAAAVAGATLLAALIPYIANGRFGIPAVGYTNDPAAHFVWIYNLQSVPASEGVIPGYPIGPHSLMAALASGTGIQIDWILSGLLVALPPLIGWTALSLLDGLGAARRALAATLVAVAYAVSAFYAQAGFKELLLTLFLLASLGIARAEARRAAAPRAFAGVQIGLLCAAIVTSFSYGGLAWPALTAIVWVVATGALTGYRRRGDDAPALARATAGWLRRALPPALLAGAVAALAVAADLRRLIDSLTVFGTSPAGAGSIETGNVGHLAGQVSKREIFGFWPREDFRFAFDQTLPNEILGLLAIAVAVYGGLWWVWRRDLAVPAAVAAAVLIAVQLSDTESAYTASKALAPAGALVMLMSARALLAAPPIPRPSARWALAAVAALFVASALWSSFLVLRGAHVGPRDRADELAQLVPEVSSGNVLFLGNDDYAQWEMVPASTFVLPATRPAKRWDFKQQLDFDSVGPETLDAAPFTITTRTEYRSEAPPNLRLVRSTDSYDLWRRRGPTPPRLVLPAEGPNPGALLDCSRGGRALARRTGWARIWTTPPRRVRVTGDAFNLLPGERATVPVFLPAGHWELSLQYVSPQPVRVSLGRGDEGAVPANLERPGPVWRVADVTQRAPGWRRVEIHVEDDLLGATETPAAFEALAFARIDSPRRLVPLRAACGRYVDWYTLGPQRPAVAAGAG